MKRRSTFSKAAMALAGLALAFAETQAVGATEYKDLLSVCVKQELSACKLKSETVKSDQMKKYSKALQCVKFGSTSGDTFSLGLPIPDVGVLGVDLGNTATSTSEQCKEEISKLNSSDFLKQVSESFDPVCARTLAGQSEQCFEAIKTMNSPGQPPQSLRCSAVQSATQLAIHTKYVPGALEGPENYKVASITGLAGLECDKKPIPGINQTGVFTCKLPKNHPESNLVVKLANSVSCSVPVSPPISNTLVSAQINSCYATLTGAKTFNEIPPLMRTTMIGQCETCLAANLTTGSADLRSLNKRVRGCAAWSVASLAEARANYCAVQQSSEGHSMMPISDPFGTHDPNAPPAFFGTAQGTAIEMSISAVPQGGNQEVESRWAKSLCNGRRIGQVIQLHGQAWQHPPIDYLNTLDGKADFVRAILEELK